MPANNWETRFYKCCGRNGCTEADEVCAENEQKIKKAKHVERAWLAFPVIQKAVVFRMAVSKCFFDRLYWTMTFFDKISWPFLIRNR